MRYEVTELVEHSDVWVAQAIGDDGEVYRAIFEGPDAKLRAEGYADVQNGVVT